MKNYLEEPYFRQLDRGLPPGTKGDPQKIHLVNACLGKMDDHFIDCIDSVDSHKTYINALFHSLPLLEEFNQYVDPAYMKGLMDSMNFLERNLSDNTKLKAYAEKAILILDIYINLVLKKYINKEIKEAAALDFIFDYGKKVGNYLIKAQFPDFEKKGEIIIRDLHQQKANSLKEKVSFLRSAFQSYADCRQQMMDAELKFPNEPFSSRLILERLPKSLALAWVMGRVAVTVANSFTKQVQSQLSSHYSFHALSGAEEEKLVPTLRAMES